MEMSVKQENWRGAAQNSRNLSGVQLTLGETAEARISAQRSVDYAKQSGNKVDETNYLAWYANVAHQLGDTKAASAMFHQAEQLQLGCQIGYIYLHSVAGFNYCDLLLEQGFTDKVLYRVNKTIQLKDEGWYSLLSVSLDLLTLGRVYLEKGGLVKAILWLDRAVASLRLAGMQDSLSRGLLARAAFYRLTGSFDNAREDLQEVFGITESSGMRLHLTDYYLEMVGLILAESHPNSSKASLLKNEGSKGESSSVKMSLPTAKDKIEGISQHLREAERLINETGYHRRDAELSELKQAISQL